jgi:hypothetical protein
MEYSRSRVPGETARLKQKLVHVEFFKEGRGPSVHEQRNFLRSFEPDVAKDSVTAMQSMISTWPEDPVKYGMISAARTLWYSDLNRYDITAEELRDKDGARMLLLRVYEKIPKRATPTASAQKNESGWLSKIFGRP